MKRQRKRNFNLSFVRRGVWTFFPRFPKKKKKLVDQKWYVKFIFRVQKYLEDRDREHLGRFWEFLTETHKIFFFYDKYFTFNHAWLIFCFIEDFWFFCETKENEKKSQKTCHTFHHTLIFMLTFFTIFYDFYNINPFNWFDSISRDTKRGKRSFVYTK